MEVGGYSFGDIFRRGPRLGRRRRGLGGGLGGGWRAFVNGVAEGEVEGWQRKGEMKSRRGEGERVRGSKREGAKAVNRRWDGRG